MKERGCTEAGDMVYLAITLMEPGRRVVVASAKPIGSSPALARRIAQGLAQCHRSLGDEDALGLAGRLLRYVMRDSGHHIMPWRR